MANSIPAASCCEYCKRFKTVQAWMGERILENVCTSSGDLSCRIAQTAYKVGFKDGAESKNDW